MKNIPDEYVRAVLGKIGEQPIPGNTRNRWGKQQLLSAATMRQATFIATDTFDLPTPLAVMLSFSTDGVIYSPTVPAIGNNTVEVDLIRGLDPQTAPVTDHHSLAEGDTQTFCGVIAQSLQVVVRLDGEPIDSLFVAVVVAPVSNIDCADVLGPSSGFLGFENVSNTTLPVLAFPATGNRPANPLRKYLAIQNMSDQPLAISLGAFMDWTPGSEAMSIILPPSINGIWEAPTPMYRGVVTLSNQAAGTGFTLITEGQ